MRNAEIGNRKSECGVSSVECGVWSVECGQVNFEFQIMNFKSTKFKSEIRSQLRYAIGERLDLSPSDCRFDSCPEHFRKRNRVVILTPVCKTGVAAGGSIPSRPT